MANRLAPLFALLLAACGASDGAGFDEPAAVDGPAAPSAAAGSVSAPVATAGAESVATPSGASGAPAGGTGGSGAVAAVAGGGGQQTVGLAGTGGEAGAPSVAGAAYGGTGGQPSGGAPGAGTGGGVVADPLDPKPMPDCPGYVRVVVPHATCVWFRGKFSFQSQACAIDDPKLDTCATASAPGVETSTIVSDTALIERFDFDDSGCPKACN